MANIKIERLNHTYQEVISSILMKEIKDKDIKFVTITGVEVTKDYSYAKIYYTVLDEEKKESTKKALEKASPFIRTKLAEKVEVRHTPELRFIYDNSISYGEHIDQLIREIKEKE
ncbi:MAG: 30S ribosome-binding factor RbfA [Bacilli bacterium]|nr:30S ribosome-binding factor RbfA [Bacilli bacterium]